MFFIKKRLSKETLEFLEHERKCYNEELNMLKWHRGTGGSPELIQAIEDAMEATVKTIRAYKKEPVFDIATGEMIKLE